VNFKPGFINKMILDKYLQVVAHFYRGEMNRLTIYRTRLDNTFQYSIVLTSALLVYNLQHPYLKYFPCLIVFLNLFFCFIEARRYRYFLIIQDRVAIMEKGFLCDQVLEQEIAGDWKADLATVFITVKFTKGFVNCVCIRYFRNYIWLIDLVIAVWLYLTPPLIMYYILGGIVLVQHLFYFRINKDVPDL
jgi:uncharacterized membrane protein